MSDKETITENMVKITMTEKLWEHIKGIPLGMCDECGYDPGISKKCYDCRYQYDVIFHAVYKIEKGES